MLDWKCTAALIALPILIGIPAAAEGWQPEMGPPRLVRVPVPDDPEQFDCAWGSEQRLALLEKLNRCDRDVLREMDTAIIPLDWYREETDYCPLPTRIGWANETDRLILVHAPMQAFAAYENGVLIHWGPISSGGRHSPTPAGAYFLNWKSKGRNSTVNRSWFLRWYYNFENATGRSFHEYALPGLPVSHGCIRLLGRDARWMYDWGESWRLDEGGVDVQEYGTPVVIIGEYDFDSPPPWRDPELVSQGFLMSRLGYWAARAAELLSAERLRVARDLLLEAPVE